MVGFKVGLEVGSEVGFEVDFEVCSQVGWTWKASLALLGVVAGALASALGIGGGIIFVPAFVSIFGFSQLEAQGTSLAIIVGTSRPAAIGISSVR